MMKLPYVSIFFSFSFQDGVSVTSTYPNPHEDNTAMSAMAISDADRSELVEAVAALKIARPSLPLKAPLAEVTTVDPGRVDSGYASANSSQRSSPDSSKISFVNGGTAVSKTVLSWGIPSRKKIKLMPFDKPIPILTQNRFDNLRELHADSLNRLTRGLVRCRGILMSLKVLGESETTAAPWVFIQCDKAIAGKVRRFFKQPAVQSDFKPPHPDAYTPKLEIYVLELPPLALHTSSTSSVEISSYERVDLYCEKGGILASESLCGSKVSVEAHGEIRSATIGGLISIQSTGGDVRILGITAGHFLAEEQYTSLSEEGEEDIDEFDDGFSDRADDDVFELDMSSFSTQLTILSEQDDTEIEIPREPRIVIGHVFKASQDDLRDQANLDWVLFTVDDTSLHLPNSVMKRKVLRSVQPRITSEDKKVVLSTATSGSASGVLSRSWSYLMLAPGKSLVRTHALTISDGLALKPGDSGAWVIDDVTNEIYGHVVASDVSGVAYVVPIDDIFEDIKVRLSLEAVDVSFFPSISEGIPEVEHDRHWSDGSSDTAVNAPQLYALDHHQYGPANLNLGSNSAFTYDLKSYTYDPSQASYGPPPTVYSLSGVPTASPKQEHYPPDSGYSTMNNSPAPSPPTQNNLYRHTTYPAPETYPALEPYPAPALVPARVPSYPQIIPNIPSEVAPTVGMHTSGPREKSRFQRLKAKLRISKK